MRVEESVLYIQIDDETLIGLIVVNLIAHMHEEDISKTHQLLINVVIREESEEVEADDTVESGIETEGDGDQESD